MTVDPLDRLRAVNPVPDGSTAPPLAHVLDQIHAGARPVVVAALALLGHRAPTTHSRSVPASRPVPSLVPAAPAGGMRGVVEAYGIAVGPSGTGAISLQQCQPCHAAPGVSGGQRYANWLATTADGGASWTVTRHPWSLYQPSFEGADGWAQGVSAARAAGFYVTHDGGRTWASAPSASPSLGGGHVSVAGGEVWSVGERCAARCTVTVLRGSWPDPRCPPHRVSRSRAVRPTCRRSPPVPAPPT
jgi:hypothetical protein